MLADYPVDVIHAVCDPRSGIASRLKWLPTIAEVKEACEREMIPIAREIERQRQRDVCAKMIEGQREARPSLDELKAKFGPNWGIKDAAEESSAARSEAFERASARSEAAIIAEWGDEKPPTICGVPISKSLAKLLGARLNHG